MNEDEQRHECEVDEEERLTPTDCQEEDRLQAALGLRLTRYPLDVRATSQAVTDRTTDGAAPRARPPPMKAPAVLMAESRFAASAMSLLDLTPVYRRIRFRMGRAACNGSVRKLWL